MWRAGLTRSPQLVQRTLSTWFKPPPVRRRKRREADAAARRVLAVVEAEPLSVRTGESWALVGPSEREDAS